MILVDWQVTKGLAPRDRRLKKVRPAVPAADLWGGESVGPGLHDYMSAGQPRPGRCDFGTANQGRGGPRDQAACGSLGTYRLR